MMRCVDFKSVERATLRGFAVIEMPSGLVLLDVSLHARDGKRWCSPPSKPMIDRDRRLMVDDDGKPRYAPLIEFIDAKTRFRWSSACVAAIDAYLDGKAPARGGRDEQQGGGTRGSEPEARRES